MSIAHRLSGLALYGATLLLTLWFAALAGGADWFAYTVFITGHWGGTVILILLSWAFFHHFFGGIRHLIWDLGYMLSLSAATALAQLTFVFGLAAAALFWLGIWQWVWQGIGPL